MGVLHKMTNEMSPLEAADARQVVLCSNSTSLSAAVAFTGLKENRRMHGSASFEGGLTAKQVWPSSAPSAEIQDGSPVAAGQVPASDHWFVTAAQINLSPESFQRVMVARYGEGWSL